MPAVVAGERHMMVVFDVPTASGSAGIAFDKSELEALRLDLGRQMELHARTLDQLKTAVAIFDRKKRLVFYNTEYRRLWSLDAAWLDQGPTDLEILDWLRANRRLPEQADFRGWKESLLAAYHFESTRRSRCGICRTDVQYVRSSIPIRRAASPISSTT